MTVHARVARKTVEHIPSPLDGYFGYRHSLLRELNSAAMFTTILVYTQQTLINKLRYLVTRTQPTPPPPLSQTTPHGLSPRDTVEDC